MWPLSYPTTRSTFFDFGWSLPQRSGFFFEATGGRRIHRFNSDSKKPSKDTLGSHRRYHCLFTVPWAPKSTFFFFFGLRNDDRFAVFWWCGYMIPFFFFTNWPSQWIAFMSTRKKDIPIHLWTRFLYPVLLNFISTTENTFLLSAIRTFRLLKALIAIGQPVQFYVAIDTWDSNDTRRHVLYVSNTSDSRSAEIYGWYCWKSHGWISFLKKECSSLQYEPPMNLIYSIVGKMCFHVPIVEGKTSSFMRSWSCFFLARGSFVIFWTMDIYLI